MNICITGALGHIGSHLIRNLHVRSLKKVYLVDNLSTQRYASLFNLPPRNNFRFFEMDILSKEMESIIKDCDILVHLAAVTDAETSFHKRGIVNKVNKRGLKNVAALCARHNCSLIFLSTTSVYGSQSETVDECCKRSELSPQSPYAESKLYGERLLKRLARTKGLKFIILRLGTIFGYSIGMRFHTAVNKFIWQAINGKEITVWKTALSQKRPYCGLGDCVGAINYIINNDIFDGQTYNIVTVNSTVKDILNTIKEYIPGIKIKFIDSAIMNQLSYTVSNRKSLSCGFRYNDTFKKKIKETIENLKNVNSAVTKKNL